MIRVEASLFRKYENMSEQKLFKVVRRGNICCYGKVNNAKNIGRTEVNVPLCFIFFACVHRVHFFGKTLGVFS